jgi:periplasmic copper chaperone A
MTMTHFRRCLPEMEAVFAVCLILIAALVSAPALGGEQELAVSGAWIRFITSPLPAAAYFRLSNKGAKPRVLIGADSAACGMLMLHESLVENGMDRMVTLKSVQVPAHGRVDFKPGGYHLMCMAPSKEMAPGHQVTITLRFADGESITARFTVRGATGT